MTSSLPKANKRLGQRPNPSGGARSKTWTHGIDKKSWYRHGLKEYTWTYGSYMD